MRYKVICLSTGEEVSFGLFSQDTPEYHGLCGREVLERIIKTHTCFRSTTSDVLYFTRTAISDSHLSILMKSTHLFNQIIPPHQLQVVEV
jgi:hypothetical protein